MRILLTGGSSLTGLAFADRLKSAGHEVICPLRRAPEAYEGIRRERVDLLQRSASLRPGIEFGSDEFLALIRQEQPWDLLCHHASEVANYKSPEFDTIRALELNARNLRQVLAALKEGGGKGVLLTGTVFEADEGAGEEPLRAFSPYGLSKGLAWQMFRYYCGAAGVALGKFVIPNPFGAFEEPRFTAYLMKNWKEGKVTKVMTPDYVRDNIHADLLAAVYVKFAQRLTATGGGWIKANPSGYVGSQGEFAERVAREVRERTGWACELELTKQEDFSEPMKRTNLEPAVQMIEGWDERAAWDAFVEYYAGRV